MASVFDGRFYRRRGFVQAMQWMKPGDVPSWAVKQVREHPKPLDPALPAFFVILTPAGYTTGMEGDWIVLDAAGGTRVMDNTSFCNLYELSMEVY